MATIARRNEYELAVGRLDQVADVTEPSADIVAQAVQEVNQWKAVQNTQVVLGGMGRMVNRNYQHDKNPLVIYFSVPIRDLRAVAGLNLHYLSNRDAGVVVEWVKGINSPRLSRGMPPELLWDFVKDIPIEVIPYRIYPLHAIAPFQYIPVADWETVARTERSRWQGIPNRDLHIRNS